MDGGNDNFYELVGYLRGIIVVAMRADKVMDRLFYSVWGKNKH